MVLPGLPGYGEVKSTLRVPPAIEINLNNPPLSSEQRGVIITSPVQPVYDLNGKLDRAVAGFQIEPAHLRTTLLFYDVIETFPDLMPGCIIRMRDIEFLEGEGIVRRATIKVNQRGPTHEISARAKVLLYKSLSDREAGRWVIGSTGENLYLGENATLDAGGVILDLFGKLPVPASDVPLDDILTFKNKRRAELCNLRYEIERLYGVIAGGDDYTKAIEVERFDRALQGYLKVMRETPFRKMLARITSNMNVNLVRLASMTVVPTVFRELPLSDALVTGLTAFSVTAGFGLKGARQTASPFRYIGRYHEELPWQ